MRSERESVVGGKTNLATIFSDAKGIIDRLEGRTVFCENRNLSNCVWFHIRIPDAIVKL